MSTRNRMNWQPVLPENGAYSLRRLPCPTCGAPNKMTRQDLEQGYICNDCADTDKGGFRWTP